jgi:hypothetical protein
VRIFLAYPSESHVFDSMKRLAGDLEAVGHQVETWPELVSVKFVFDPIREAIERSDLILAETTYGNPNVLFELGYSIAISKLALQLVDENTARPRNLPPLDIVRHIPYTKREDVLAWLSQADLRTPLLEAVLSRRSTSPKGGLYFLPSRLRPDVNETAWKICKDSVFACKTIDT